MKKLSYTLAEGEKVLAEFEADNSTGFMCFFKQINESSVVITNRRILTVNRLGLKICMCCGAVTTSFKECLVSGLNGVNGYSHLAGGFLCFRKSIYTIEIGTHGDDSISFSPSIKKDEEAQAILHKIAEISEQAV